MCSCQLILHGSFKTWSFITWAINNRTIVKDIWAKFSPIKSLASSSMLKCHLGLIWSTNQIKHGGNVSHIYTHFILLLNWRPIQINYKSNDIFIRYLIQSPYHINIHVALCSFQIINSRYSFGDSQRFGRDKNRDCQCMHITLLSMIHTQRQAYCMSVISLIKLFTWDRLERSYASVTRAPFNTYDNSALLDEFLMCQQTQSSSC